LGLPQTSRPRSKKVIISGGKITLVKWKSHYFGRKNHFGKMEKLLFRAEKWVGQKKKKQIPRFRRTCKQQYDNKTL